jgi:uncharacterized membrane protein
MKPIKPKHIAYTGIFAAVGIIFGTILLIPTPVPNVYLDLSHIGTVLSAILLGPVFGGITGFIVGIWPGITFGNYLVPPFKALTGIFIAILSKKTRPGLAVFVGYLPEAFFTYLTLAILKIPYGLPLPVVYTILMKAFAEIIILGILMEIIMRNKGVKHFLQSKVAFLYL